MSTCDKCGAPVSLALDGDPHYDDQRIKKLGAELAKVRGDLAEQVRRKRVIYGLLKLVEGEFKQAVNHAQIVLGDEP